MGLVDQAGCTSKKTAQLLMCRLVGSLPTIRGNPISRVRIDEDLGSSSNLSTISTWFSECQHSHPVCWPNDNPEMPTRVVDVGSGDASPDTVRVVSTSGLRQRYAALSHCWGGKIQHVLQESNLDEFQTAVPCSILARNFRDAITITRSLGLRYLWIDSLCIIQDSVADWERESQRMTFVYRDAAVTIYAAESKGSTEGILIRSPEFPGPQPVAPRVFADSTDDTKATVSRMDESSLENLFTLTNFSHLAKRGWCLQEEMLSPRRLTFGKFGAYWQCPHTFRATNGLPPGGVNQYPERLPSLSSVLHSPALPTPRDREDTLGVDNFTLLREYYGMVASYCGRRLTVPSDKLPALAGVVAALAGVLGKAGDEALYLAGIWCHNMAIGLLWRFDGGPLLRAPVYRAPSWSWASVDGEVIFDLADDDKPYETTEWDLKIVEGRITLKNRLYRFGEVAAGFLDVQGYTLPLVCSTHVIDQAACRPFTLGYCSFDWLPDGHGTHSLFKVIGEEGIWLASIRTQFVYPESEPSTDVLDEVLGEEHCFSREYKAIILKVQDDMTGSMFGRGLVLLRQEDSDNYERVGCVEKVELSGNWTDEWDYEELRMV